MNVTRTISSIEYSKKVLKVIHRVGKVFSRAIVFSVGLSSFCVALQNEESRITVIGLINGEKGTFTLRIPKDTMRAIQLLFSPDLGITHRDKLLNDLMGIIRSREDKDVLLDCMLDVSTQEFMKARYDDERAMPLNIAIKILLSLAMESEILTCKVIAVAENSLASEGITAKFKALELFINLVKDGAAFQQAICAAQYMIMYDEGSIVDVRKDVMSFGLFNTSELTRDLALELFRVLFRRNYAFDEAIQIAREMIKSENNFLTCEAIKLLVAIMKEVDQFTDIQQTFPAQLCIDPVMYTAATILIDLALQSENIKKQIISIASEMVANHHAIPGIILFRELVKNKQAFVEATQAALKVTACDLPFADYYSASVTAEKGLSLLCLLVIEGQAFSEAAHIARKFILQTQTARAAQSIFGALIEKDQTFIKIAEDAVYDAAIDSFRDFGPLFKELCIDSDKNSFIKTMQDMWEDIQANKDSMCPRMFAKLVEEFYYAIAKAVIEYPEGNIITK